MPNAHANMGIEDIRKLINNSKNLKHLELRGQRRKTIDIEKIGTMENRETRKCMKKISKTYGIFRKLGNREIEEYRENEIEKFQFKNTINFK